MKFATLCLWLLSAFHAWASPLPSATEDSEECEPPAAVIRSPESVIRVGYTPFGLMIDERLMLNSLKSTLSPEKLGHPVTFRQYSAHDLAKAVRAGEVDIVFSESPFYQALISEGLRSVTTFVCDVQPDPNRNDGTAVIVRSDSLAKTFEDLRGKKLTAVSRDTFSGYLYAIRELVQRKLGDPDHFFSKQTFVADRTQSDVNEHVFNDVVGGKSDVGFLPLCALEEMSRRDPSILSKVRVVEERLTDTVTDCRHSTPLYPALTLSVTPRISASMSKAITMDLLMLPKGENGFMWSVASDFQSANNVLKDLQLGPYEYLRQTGLKRIWQEYRSAIITALLLILALIAHGARSQWLVKKRETELKASIGLQLAQREKMERLQKVGAVGQISGLVAHELRQPLSAISLYAEGLEEMVRNDAIGKKEMLDILHSMTTDAARASDIVERVRQYAKQKAELKPISVREAFDKADEMVTHFGIGNVPTHVSAFEDSTVLVNPLDLQLVFGNLIKNAKEAAAQQTDESPQLLVKAQVMEGFICIELEDNGPPLSDRELAGLNEVVTSAKPDGLGLGLSISRNIVEGIGGHIVFKRRFRNTGLRTCVKLPVSAGTVKPLGD
jgi:two-component system sensor histidine kinase TtrS